MWGVDWFFWGGIFWSKWRVCTAQRSATACMMLCRVVSAWKQTAMQVNGRWYFFCFFNLKVVFLRRMKRL